MKSFLYLFIATALSHFLVLVIVLLYEYVWWHFEGCDTEAELFCVLVELDTIHNSAVNL